MSFSTIRYLVTPIPMIFLNSNHEFVALFNNAAIGIIVVDSKGDIVQINDFALRQFIYGREDILGRKIELLIPKRYEKEHVEHRQQYEGNMPSRPMGTGMDLSALKSDGTEFPAEVSLSPYDGQNEKFVIAFVSDISVRKESELALLKLNAELEQKVNERTRSLSEALEKEKDLSELKSRFVSMASHEFRTPLSTILSSVYLVSKYVNQDEQAHRDKHIQRIVSSVNILSDILNDFLSVGKMEEGKMQVRMSEFNFKEFVQQLNAELQPILKPGQTITYSHSGDETIVLDHTILKLIVINLISNAIKFSLEGSAIYVDTQVDERGIGLSVKDEGLGIPEEDQQHLFERFFRAGNVMNIQGTGLGLHIVSKYVELMDGDIRFESKQGTGTVFFIQFKTPDHLYEDHFAD